MEVRSLPVALSSVVGLLLSSFAGFTAESVYTVQVEPGPFIGVKHEFWRPEPGTPIAVSLPDLVIWVEPNTLRLRTHCHGVGIAFNSSIGGRLKFNNYFEWDGATVST